MELGTWFLTAQERGNPACRLPAWSAGNAVRALVNGAVYFARLAEEVEALQAGDHLFSTDWRGDAGQRFGTIGDLFCAAARHGVVVKATATAAADALGDWHRDGRRGPRPAGRLRHHEPESLPLRTRLWAEPVYRLLYDPDGRGLRDRYRGRW
jgi:hypothetical protein